MYGHYLWPSWFLLLGEQEEITLSLLLGLAFAIFVNMVLYALVGAIAFLLWKLLSRMFALQRKI